MTNSKRLRSIRILVKALLKEYKVRKGNLRSIADKNNGMIHYESCKKLLNWDEKQLNLLLDLIDNKNVEIDEDSVSLTLEDKIELLKQERKRKNVSNS